MMRIHTVAAGGGSILHYDGARFRVGPDRAGADPGPDCLSPRRPAHRHRRQRHARQAEARVLPAIFGPGARSAARRRRRAQGIQAARPQAGDGRAPEEIADGFISIAVENMANAIKKISVAARLRRDRVRAQVLRRGGRPACLPRRRCARHQDGADASAVGRCCRPMAWDSPRIGAARTRPCEAPLDDDDLRRARKRCDGRSAARRRHGARAPGRRRTATSPSRAAHLRYAGTDTALPVAARRSRAACARLRGAHRQRFGFVWPEKDIVVDAVEVEARGGGEPIVEAELAGRETAAPPDAAARRGSSREARGTRRRSSCARPRAGPSIAGPALIIEPHQTIVVEPGWQARGHRRATISCSRASPSAQARASARGRSGDAGGVQQSLHGDRRADGQRCGTPPNR